MFGEGKKVACYEERTYSRKQQAYFIFALPSPHPSPKRRGGIKGTDRNHRHSLPQHRQHILEYAVFRLKITIGSNREQRKPMLLLVFVGSFLLRLAERTLLSLLFHVPSRSTPPASLHHRHMPENAFRTPAWFSTNRPAIFPAPPTPLQQSGTVRGPSIFVSGTCGHTNAAFPILHPPE